MYNFKNENDFRIFLSNNIVTTNEATKILGCSRQYINQLVKKNKLIPVKKINYVTLFLKTDIEKIIE